MMNKMNRISLALLVLFVITFSGFAQVSEDNVRAQLTFLASDALQGRGSGTI